jgi:YesN/AraC family two-component response regulator
MTKIVLIADDNALIRKSLCEMFESEEGYDLCAEAKNGKEAIELAQHYRPALIILDLLMPIMKGIVAARELKRIMPMCQSFFSRSTEIPRG